MVRYNLVKRFFLNVAASYDRVVIITTFGRDKAWKREIISYLPDVDRCLDLGCGSGILTSIAKSKARLTIGLDLIYPSLLIAKQKGNEVIQAVAEYIPLKGESVDAIIASYLPKYCDAKLTIKECARVLKKGGILIMHDFTYPKGIVKILWRFYFLILRFVGIFTPNWRTIFKELDKVIKESRWVEDIIREMNINGFIDIRYKPLTFNTSAIVYGKRG